MMNLGEERLQSYWCSTHRRRHMDSSKACTSPGEDGQADGAETKCMTPRHEQSDNPAGASLCQ